MINKYFTDGSNKSVVYKTLGSFWTSVFKDQKLIDGVIKAQTHISDEIDQNIRRTYDLLNEPECPNFLLTTTYKVKVDAANISPVKKCIANDSLLSNTVFIINQSDNSGAYTITLPRSVIDCRLLSNTVEFNDVVLLKDIDFTQTDNKTLVLKKHPSKLGFRKNIILQNGALTDEYTFYIKGSYSNVGYNARFGRTPSATNKNNITYNLLTKENTLTTFVETLQKLVGVVPPSIEGRVTRIWYENGNTIVFNGSIVSIPSYLQPDVQIGDIINPSSILIKDIRLFEDISDSTLYGYYISPDRLRYTKEGIVIPNTNIPGVSNGNEAALSEPLVTEDDAALESEAGYTFLTEDDYRIIPNMGIKGTEEDVALFYDTVLKGLANYGKTLQSVATSNNPVKIIFKDIHNTTIPTIEISNAVLQRLASIETIASNIAGMSYSTPILIGGSYPIKTNVEYKLEDHVDSFIVYNANTAASIDIQESIPYLRTNI